MPVLNLIMTKEDGGATKEQKKAALIEGFTKVFVDVVGRGEKTMVVTIQEFETDNYGIGGETITKIRQK